MNFGLSFSYIFKDQDWFKKLLIPALCMLIPIVGWMVSLGWALKVTRNVMDGVEEPLPELDFGGDILRGFFAFLISFIYSLPVTVLSSISGWIGNWQFYHNETALLGMGLLTAVIGFISFALGLVTTFLSLGAIANYIGQDDFGAAFRFGEVWRLVTANIGDWLLVLVGMLIAVGLIGPLGTVACIIGVILTMTYGLAVTGHMLGQAYVGAKNKMTPVVELAE